jgi:para-aminobenzoate synthetase component I
LETTLTLEEMAGRLSGVEITPLALTEPFETLAACFAATPGTVVLLSGTNLDCARYHMLGVYPWLTLSMAAGRPLLTVDGISHHPAGSPFDVLKALTRRLALPADAVLKAGDAAFSLPVIAGLFGYLAYDLKDVLEELPRTSVDDLQLPGLFMTAPSVLVVHDRLTGSTWRCIPLRGHAGDSPAPGDLADRFERERRAPPPAASFEADRASARSGFSPSEYMAAVERIKDYIVSGHVYQVNLSQRFEMDFRGDPYRLFLTLFEMNPAPFFAYVNAGDHQIVSTSPERFIQLAGRRIETRPIKGTRPRGQSQAEDEANRKALASSRKDDAELSMIVDLLRNDIGKVARAGSVSVAEHKRVEAYQNVYHLVSIVEGELASRFDAVDLIRATFPGGSITGCPKIRSMEIIDELEPCRRHVYTGAIGYIGFHDTLDLSIAIRTATVINGRMLFSVGGGIVFDSDPADEYEETLHKGQTLMRAADDAAGPPASPVVWFNGHFQRQNEARVPVTDPGLVYGYGLFETLRAVNGRPLRLSRHLGRFEHSWRQLFQTDPPDVTWAWIIEEVLRQNGLHHVTAAVKILATRGERESAPWTHQLLVAARPYEHRLTGKEPAGLHLSVYPEPRQTPLSDHKSLNYLYYFLAGKWARARGADEALILNPDGTVSETSTAGLLMVVGRRVLRPLSPHVLPSIMQERVCTLLADWGYTLETVPLTSRQLQAADTVLLTNALMGAVPALSIDGAALAGPGELWRQINETVLSDE